MSWWKALFRTKYTRGSVAQPAGVIKNIANKAFHHYPFAEDSSYIILTPQKTKDLFFDARPTMPDYGQLKSKKGSNWPDCNFYARVTQGHILLRAANKFFAWSPVCGLIDYNYEKNGKTVRHLAIWTVTYDEDRKEGERYQVWLYHPESQRWESDLSYIGFINYVRF